MEDHLHSLVAPLEFLESSVIPCFLLEVSGGDTVQVTSRIGGPTSRNNSSNPQEECTECSGCSGGIRRRNAEPWQVSRALAQLPFLSCSGEASVEATSMPLTGWGILSLKPEAIPTLKSELGSPWAGLQTEKCFQSQYRNLSLVFVLERQF